MVGIAIGSVRNNYKRKLKAVSFLRAQLLNKTTEVVASSSGSFSQSSMRLIFFNRGRFGLTHYICELLTPCSDDDNDLKT